jgi:hypothetical protein
VEMGESIILTFVEKLTIKVNIKGETKDDKVIGVGEVRKYFTDKEDIFWAKNIIVAR